MNSGALLFPHVAPPLALHCGDAVEVLRATVSAASVDLVYLDPPFLTQQDWKGKAGSFSDRWTWDNRAAEDFAELQSRHPTAAIFIAGVWGKSAAAAYYSTMALLLIELRRALKLTGSLWLHADDTAMHGLRILGDGIFGPANALGTVVWKRASAHSNAKGFGRVHDTIAAWGRSRATRWRLARTRGEFIHGDPCERVYVDGFAEDALNARSKERVGYPTQKPVALLERIVLGATLRGDTVLDPVCGSGTTLVAALKHGRRAIGIDRSPDAISTAQRRAA